MVGEFWSNYCGGLSMVNGGLVVVVVVGCHGCWLLDVVEVKDCLGDCAAHPAMELL